VNRLEKQLDGGTMRETAMQSQRRSSWLDIGKDFNTMTWVLMPVAIAINMAVGQIVAVLKLPVFLDSIGTVLVGVICGPWAGALTGALANTILGLTINPDFLPWWPVAALIGLVSGICANYGMFKSWWKVVVTGFIIALVAAMASVPIALLVYGGITASGAGLITAFLVESGRGMVQAVFASSFLTEPVDKITSALLAFAIIQGLSKRFLARFPRAENVETDEKISRNQLLIAVGVVVLLILFAIFLLRNLTGAA
jgi:energy-coupling factor transport system substrate-specific component